MTHPITPPPKLVTSWIECAGGGQNAIRRIATCAAQWGADMELEACCEVLHQHDRAYLLPSQLRATRRPKAPSLAEEALNELNLTSDCMGASFSRAQVKLIRRALERLQALEGGND